MQPNLNFALLNMETQNFEDKLLQMTKPEVSNLKHQDMLAGVIIKAKDKSVLSFWWLCLPLYIIAAFLMKSAFMPQATLASSIYEFISKEKYLSVIVFLIAPLAFIVLNLISIRKVYIMLGNPKAKELVKVSWFNLLIVLLFLLVLVIYSL
jgi:hypothetical protein